MLNTMPNLIGTVAYFTEKFGLLVFGAITIGALLLYLTEHRKNHQRSLQPDQSILRKAYKKAQKILGQAELEAVKVVADSKVFAQQLDGRYEGQLQKTAEKLEKSLDSQLGRAQQEYGVFLDDLKTQAQQTQLLNQEYTKQKTSELFEKFESNLANFLTQTEQKSVASIELEMRAAKQLIDTYKEQQLALIDENIIAVLEKTLSVVLAKKLSLKDQMDLVYEALEKAKVEKLIA